MVEAKALVACSVPKGADASRLMLPSLLNQDWLVLPGTVSASLETSFPSAFFIRPCQCEATEGIAIS